MEILRYKVCSVAASDLEAAFPYMSMDEAIQLCPYLETREYPAGSIVIREGDVSDSMVFVCAGRLNVKRETSFAGKHILVAVLDKGSMAGEISVLERSPRSATVEAVEKTRVLLLSSDAFDALLLELPFLGIKLLLRIIHVVGIRVRKADDRLSRLL